MYYTCVIIYIIKLIFIEKKMHYIRYILWVIFFTKKK